MADHLVGRGHLQVEARADGRAQALDVVVVDVASVFAQVRVMPSAPAASQSCAAKTGSG
jgi:hypothetical protein